MDFKNKLKNFWRMNAQSAKGFTLVELIVVIAILAILAGIAIPAYSGYVEKAKRAEDEQLLATVNTAFAAACIENGTDIYNVDEALIKLTSDKAVAELTVPRDFNDAFMTFYTGNEDAKFQVMEGIIFDELVHAFVEIGEGVKGYAYAGGLIYVDAADVNKLNESTFGKEIGAQGLMDKVDFVTLLSAELLKDAPEDSKFANMIMGAEYGTILGNSLGIDMSTEEGVQTFISTVGGLVDKKMDLLIASGKYAEDADRSEGSDLYTDAYYQIVANNAVLHAAKNSNAEGVADQILTVLGGNNSKAEILKTVNKDSGAGLSQAAIAYGLYTAYATKNGLTVPENPADVLLQIDSDVNFKNYINNTDGSGQAQKDLEGYLAAMNMINTNVESNTDAVSDILVNGFANKELVGLLQQAMGDK